MINITSIYKQIFGANGPLAGNVIDMAEHGRAGGDSDAQGFKYTGTVPEKTAIDEASATVTYIGKAKTGTLTSATDWQIKRITVTGTVTLIEYAEGSDNYDYEWDERLTYSYS